MGRMPEPAELLDLLPDLWTPKILRDKKILITAGATFEAIDPVRGITNTSSGKMGVALARACRAAGAEISLIHGQLQTTLPFGISDTVQAVSAEDMHRAVHRLIEKQDAFISVAAVSDYKVKNRSTQKFKKDKNAKPLSIELDENPDTLASIASLPNPPFCIGFAAETENVMAYAREKRIKKKIPVIVANDVSIAMGKTTNQIVIIDDDAELSFPETSKDEAAMRIVERLAVYLNK